MPKESKQRSAVLQGTLDMMILKTLLYGPAHGHQIGKHIQPLQQNLWADSGSGSRPSV